MILLYAVVLAFLVVLSTAVSLSEAAITSLSTLKMKRLVLVKPWLIPFFAEWLAKPHRLIVTLLVLINLAHIGVSSMVATMLRGYETGISEQVLDLVATLSVTFGLLVFTEITPKIIGRVYRERIGPIALPPLAAITRLLSLVFGPVYWVVDKLTPGLETAPVNRLTSLSLEELHHIIGESQESGHVSSESGEMMRRVLALPQRRVEEVCQKVDAVDSVAIEALDRRDGAELFIDLMVETGRSRVPVTREGKPVGYVNVMDVLKKWRSGEVSSVEGLIRPAPEVSVQRRAVDLLADFQRTGEHMAFVMDDARRFAGIVTLEDVLEEIVGEILDEYDLEAKKD